MKKAILLILLTVTSVHGQQFRNITSSNEAIAQASLLASKSSNSKLLNSHNFAEDNLFAVRFVTPELLGSDYDKLDVTSQNQYLTVVFKTLEDKFILSRVTGSYEVIFELWKNYVSETALKDGKNKVYNDKVNRITYFLSEESDERWAISCKVL